LYRRSWRGPPNRAMHWNEKKNDMFRKTIYIVKEAMTEVIPFWVRETL
jgi:hypothetical protein